MDIGSVLTLAKHLFLRRNHTTWQAKIIFWPVIWQCSAGIILQRQDHQTLRQFIWDETTAMSRMSNEEPENTILKREKGKWCVMKAKAYQCQMIWSDSLTGRERPVSAGVTVPLFGWSDLQPVSRNLGSAGIPGSLSVESCSVQDRDLNSVQHSQLGCMLYTQLNVWEKDKLTCCRYTFVSFLPKSSKLSMWPMFSLSSRRWVILFSAAVLLQQRNNWISLFWHQYQYHPHPNLWNSVLTSILTPDHVSNSAPLWVSVSL